MARSPRPARRRSGRRLPRRIGSWHRSRAPGRPVTDRLDVVAVEVENVRTVVVWVVDLACSRRAVVGCAGVKSRFVEPFDALAVVGEESDVQPASHRLPERLDPEEGTPVSAEAGRLPARFE